MQRLSLSVLIAFSLTLVRSNAFAQDARALAPTSTPGAAATRDARRAAGKEDAEPTPVPWHGSTLLFDQSVTTQTVGVGTDYQSRNPIYEWWFAFKPRYFLFEREKDALVLNLWMNLYYEVTNSNTTATKNELVVGPTTLWALYGYTFYEKDGYRTAVTVGPRMAIPTDRASRNAGMLIALGAMAGATQSLPIGPKGATAFNSLRLGLGAIYMHPFQRATSPVNGDLEQPRQDVAGRSIASDLLRPGMNVANSLTLLFTAGLQIVPRLGIGASYVLGNAWAYAPPNVPICTVQPSCVSPTSNGDPSSFRVTTWGLVSLDYDVIDEMTVSLGYYNQTSQIGPDGKRRNPIYSPDARFFLTLTGNLDVIYERLKAPPPPSTEVHARHRRTLFE